LVFFGLVVPEAETEPEVEIEYIPPEPGYRAFKWYLSFALSPIFSLYDNLALQPEAVMALPSGMFQFGFIRSAKNSFFGLGLEAALSLFTFNAVYPTDWQYYEYQTPMRAIAFNVNLAAQKRTYNEKMAFKFRFGAGYTFISTNEEIDYPFISRPFNLNIGASFQWLAGRKFFMETGADMIYWFSGEESSGAIRPFAGLGWRF